MTTQTTARIHLDDVEGKGAESSQEELPAASLVLIVGRQIGKRFILRDPEMALGRDMACAIAVDDNSVSRTHAIIRREGAHYTIEDLGSTNGTRLNSSRVRKARLEDGDLIRVGRSVLKFLSGENVEQEYYAEIYRLTTTDGLTQVHNRRYLGELLERELARALRYQRELSVLVMDLDHFKAVNDQHGHGIGDLVLQAFCDRVGELTRRADTLCRYGGEEFVLVAPESSLADAHRLAEKIRASLAREPLSVEDSTLPVTCSFGVASVGNYLHTHPAGEERGRREPGQPNRLLEIADRRLYVAKREGRNRVVSTDR